MKRFSLCAMLACLLAAMNLVAQAQEQPANNCADVNVPIAGATETDTYAVNNAGVIAGDYLDSSFVQHGLILGTTGLQTFDGPSGSSSIAAYGINNNNVAVGWYFDSFGTETSFEYRNGGMHPIAFPNSAGTEANGINDNGWIVGSYLDSNGVNHGFYWDTKRYHTVDIPGAAQTIAWAINNANLMTVYTETSTGVSMDAYTFDGTHFKKMDVPGATESVIHGINNKGDIDYTIFDASNNRHGVLYKAATGVFTQFDDPNGTNTTRADGINDKDEMVGRYSPSSGNPANAGFKCTVN